jgi:pimeloyl-ACP methyl ester carboxylesterase
MKILVAVILVFFSKIAFSTEDQGELTQNDIFKNYLEEMQVSEDKKIFLDKKSSCPKYNNFKVCIFPGVGQRKDEVIYYFHGIFGNENQWLYNEITKKIYKRLIESNLGSPTIINISYGPVWLLTTKNTRKYSGLLDSWNNESIFKFEHEVLSFKVRKRFVFGDSMGGHNAFAFYLKNQDLFKKVILICPAMLVRSPYEERNHHHELLPDFAGSWTMYYGVMGLMAMYYDDITWKITSPFFIFSKLLKPKTKVDFIVVDNDMYGFSDVAKRFYIDNQQAQEKLHIEQQAGSHCYPQNVESITDKIQ